MLIYWNFSGVILGMKLSLISSAHVSLQMLVFFIFWFAEAHKTSQVQKVEEPTMHKAVLPDQILPHCICRMVQTAAFWIKENAFLNNLL